MSDKRTLFRIIRSVGLLGLLAFFIFIEWRVVLGGRGGEGSWLMQQLVAVVSMLMLPYFWILLALTLVGHFGKRRIDKRAAKAEAEEAESPA